MRNGLASQADRILAYLREHGAITPLEALNHCGCFRLAARIEQLRRAGHPITTTLKEHHGKRYAEYRLQETPRQPEDQRPAGAGDLRPAGPGDDLYAAG